MQETRIQSLGREDPPGVGNGSPLQYSCLESLMVRGAWQAAVCGITESDTTQWLNNNNKINVFNPVYSEYQWVINIQNHYWVAQWLRCCAFSAEGMGLLPGQDTKIPHIMKLGVEGVGVGGGTLRKPFTFFSIQTSSDSPAYFILRACLSSHCLPAKCSASGSCSELCRSRTIV